MSDDTADDAPQGGIIFIHGTRRLRLYPVEKSELNLLFLTGLTLSFYATTATAFAIGAVSWRAELWLPAVALGLAAAHAAHTAWRIFKRFEDETVFDDAEAQHD